MSSVPSNESFNAEWINLHCQHFLFVQNSNAEILITHDSLIAVSFRYSHIWEKHFTLFNALNFGIRGDHINMFFGVLTISCPYQQ